MAPILQKQAISSDEKQPILAISDLSKRFTIHSMNKQIQACQDINIEIMPGEFIGITGKSGSGKSTVLRCIYGTNLCEDGSIKYDSSAYGLIDLASAPQRQMIYLRKYEIGYVTQFLNALPRRSAYEIVLQSALESYGNQNLDYCHEETKKILSHFDLGKSLWDVFPRTFSGGEKLRLNIAAAMIKKPRLLLLDEPTASLDNSSKLKVRSLIEDLKAQGTTMLGIFHDLEFMEGLCDQEFNMQEGLMW
ncbi:MAG: phosphonate C-P lyase system protein PhnL [Raoultibacter sp.]|jgi:alpha-D-ribose 1-methylphosphonate 5-triphosphate synthase subunit PhnL